MLYPNQLQNTSGSFNRALIQYQIGIAHSLAKASGQDGVLQLFVRFADSTETETSWFEIGDVDGVPATIIRRSCSIER
jgi:hypothetical protein